MEALDRFIHDQEAPASRQHVNPLPRASPALRPFSWISYFNKNKRPREADNSQMSVSEASLELPQPVQSSHRRSASLSDQSSVAPPFLHNRSPSADTLKRAPSPLVRDVTKELYLPESPASHPSRSLLSRPRFGSRGRPRLPFRSRTGRPSYALRGPWKIVLYWVILLAIMGGGAGGAFWMGGSYRPRIKSTQDIATRNGADGSKLVNSEASTELASPAAPTTTASSTSTDNLSTGTSATRPASTSSANIAKDPNLHRSFYGICYQPADLLPACATTQAEVDSSSPNAKLSLMSE